MSTFLRVVKGSTGGLPGFQTSQNSTVTVFNVDYLSLMSLRLLLCCLMKLFHGKLTIYVHRSYAPLLNEDQSTLWIIYTL